jgi:hypothetical protein
MLAAVGHPVSKLRRESFATISLRGLVRGSWRALTGVEVARLEDIAEGIEPQNAGKKSRYKKGYARPKPKKRPPGKKRSALGKRGPSGKKLGPAGSKSAGVGKEDRAAPKRASTSRVKRRG